VTHFAIDAWLFEFQVIDVETTAFHISNWLVWQTAQMAW